MTDWGFLFSRRDRKSILAIVFLIATIGILYTMDSKSAEKTTIDFTEFKQRAENHYQKEYTEYHQSSVQPNTRFKSSFTKRIKSKPSDNTSKVTGQKLPSLKTKAEDKSTSLPQTSNSKIHRTPITQGNKKKYNSYRKYNQKLDVNTSDVIDWEALPGIGPYYSKIITDFREKLGGFTSTEQVGETWRLPDSTFLSIKPFLQMSAVYRQININQADEKTLSAHPYINWKEAKLMVNYRREHGAFFSVDELLNIKAFDEAWLIKIHPYLTAQLLAPIVQN